ncbi:hypothetical protein [Paraburkholderia humisilvae]|uniref:Uncharacterized protein n=1 Tax=Paraburkholderia humisilvae TaxID=627669 RepID=A0A6J5ELW6_9BURK|nr:hypothetical protein [Paraburkholderia humisilvae]CAB3767560.1 hypothetical protein LMG29542_05650 [Paraburkholderia humisilvae]
MKHVQEFVGLVLFTVLGVVRAGTPTVGDLIDAEATRTLHQMSNDDKSAGGGGSLPGGAAASLPTSPLPAVPGPAADEKPKHQDGLFARFGVVPNLSGYLMWNDAVYQASVGKKIKGWTVIAINADGADLRSPTGKIKHFDSLLDSGLDGDDNTSSAQTQARATAGMPQTSTPLGVPPVFGGSRPGIAGGVR